MRNLKKVLALVLAMMMALSLMSFASAATYDDNSDIEQNEAVEVMSALGVFNGIDGNFDPEGNLTRAQAAKIITYMLLGQEVADSLPNTGSQFTDCADGRWYVGSINYLTDMGIVAGRSATTFDPNGNVNGYEFAKMLLGALGYNSKTEQFEGTGSWSLNIATTARRAGLAEDLAVSTISSLPITREQAAKLAFNTLTADMVYYQGGVVVDNVTVNPTRYVVSNATSNDYRTQSGQDSIMQFCEQYFPTLKYNSSYNTPDAFGRVPAGQWVVGNDPAYTNLAEPTLVLTDKVTETALTGMLPKGVTISSVTPKDNGSNGSAIASLSALAGVTAPGKMVEIYVNDSNEISAIVTVSYKVETVDNITEKNGTTTYKFSESGNKANNDDKTDVVLEGAVEKGDVVTTATVGGKVYVYPTTTFTGSQTATKTANGVQTVTIGGAQYVVASGVTGVSAFNNSADTATYYVDVNGYLVKVEGAAAPDPEYAVIVRTVGGSSTSLDDGTAYSVSVRAILADGSIADFDLALSVLDATTAAEHAGSDGDLVSGGVVVCASGSLSDVQSTATTNLAGKLFGYTLNNDGQMVLSSVATAPANGSEMTANNVYQAALASYDGANNAAVNTDKTVLFTNDTVFVLYNDNNGVWSTEDIKTGVADLSVKNAEGIAVIGATGTTTATANVVFLKTTTVAQGTDEYVYIAKDEYSTVLVDGKSTDAWTGIAPDGTEVEVYGDHSSITKNGLYVYDTDHKLNTTAKVATDTATAAPASDKLYINIGNTGASVTGNLLFITGTTYVNITGDTQIVYLDSNLDSVAGNKCLIVMEPGSEPSNVATIYVYEAGDKAQIDATIPSTATIANDAETTTVTVTGITSETTYTVTAESADATKATVSVSGDVVTVNRVGSAPTQSDGDATVNVTITVTPTGDSADSYSAKSGTCTVTIKAAAQ